MPEVTIGKKLAKSIMHSMAGKYLVYAVQLLSMMLLARLFSPATFGLFAVIQVFAVFFALISEMGFGPALVNENDITKPMRDGIFSFTWILGICISLLFFSLSPLISWFYENDIYQYLVIPVAISIIFNTGIIVPFASLNRDKKFISIAKCEAIAEIISVLVVLLLLNYVEPIWALAVKPLIIAVARYLFIFLGSKQTSLGVPSFGKELKHIKKILAFSKDQASFNFLNYFSRNLDNILVGKYLGTIDLGVYDKAYKIMRYPLMLLTFAMAPAIQPVMKELKNNLNEFEKLHDKFIQYISVLGIVVGVITYFSADLIVLILLGNQWEMVTPLLKILSMTIPLQVVMSTSGGFYQAAGRVDLMLRCGLFSSFTNIFAIILGINFHDLEILSWSLLCSFSINYLQCYYVMGRYMLPSGVISIYKKVFPCVLVVIILALIKIKVEF